MAAKAGGDRVADGPGGRGPASRGKATRAGAGAKSERKDAAAPAPVLPPPELLPFDADFFRRNFSYLMGTAKPGPAKRTTGSAARAREEFACTVVLGDGSTHVDVGRIESLDEQVMLVEVRAEEGRIEPPRRFLFVPYAAIARVEVMDRERRPGGIGFSARLPAPPVREVRKAKKERARRGAGRRLARKPGGSKR